MTKTEKQIVGRIGEDIAKKFLEKKGFTVVGTNVLRKWGEIDLVAEKEGVVRFVEVKTQSVHTNGSREIGEYRPEEMAHRAKLEKVARTASLYMEEKGDDREYQIDVVAVLLDHGKRIARCRHYEQVL